LSSLHDTPPTDIYTLSLHDALPILEQGSAPRATHKVSAAHGLRFPWPITSHQSRAAVVRSHAQNHHLRGFDERRSAVARLQAQRSEEHTSELQSRRDLVCRLLLEKK